MRRITYFFSYTIIIVAVAFVTTFGNNYLSGCKSEAYAFPTQENTVVSPGNSNTENMAADEEKIINYYLMKKKPIYPKEVFLTFDDGPSKNNTIKILNILKENNIRATFFVVGRNVEAYPEIVKRLDIAGMSILPHSYTHDYKIYSSKESYEKDLEACSKSIYKVTGETNKGYTRLPGGSDNYILGKERMKVVREFLKRNGIYYVDWNVSSADAAGVTIPTKRIIENVTTQCKYNSFAVVLMHDSSPKSTTTEALPYIIKNLKEQGFVFRTFDDITPNEEKVMKKYRIMNR